ncbi:proline iminopeptidase-family hydrolase [Chitinophaga filiformis]|uniref:Proline iminopeptidase n=1 Tax=Chitinophaga filiformis TaxID=104663 RepID=A0A1G7S3W1_CHIFI|nr:proline iminopeptidase-family hydrolase [Chitinophaga filiformis]SDG17661.1 proline iminopeptidase [Chitinophaga filiformis]
MRNFIFLLVVVFAACNQEPHGVSYQQYFMPHDSGVQTGGVKMVEISTPKGKFHVWTKRIGNNPKMKLLLLHGGPGATHEFFECFESFLPQEGIELIEYDQLESYYSEQPNDSSLWTMEHYVEEVEQVRQALGLDSTNFYLLGHSWGGMLAIDYALKYQQHIKGLIISDMMSSMNSYAAYNKVLRGQMRKSLVDSLETYENNNQYGDSTYQALVMNEYYKKHICVLPEWPEAANRTFKHLNAAVYVTMQGPSEFKPGGRLINWDRSGDLPRIKVPTLTIGAKFDTMDPEHMKWMSTQVQNGSNVYCPEGSHFSCWDDQKHYFPGLIAFMKRVDQGTFRKG